MAHPTSKITQSQALSQHPFPNVLTYPTATIFVQAAMTSKGVPGGSQQDYLQAVARVVCIKLLLIPRLRGLPTEDKRASKLHTGIWEDCMTCSLPTFPIRTNPLPLVCCDPANTHLLLLFPQTKLMPPSGHLVLCLLAKGPAPSPSDGSYFELVQPSKSS